MAIKSAAVVIALSAFACSLSVHAQRTKSESCGEWKSRWEATKSSDPTAFQDPYVLGAIMWSPALDDATFSRVFTGPGTGKNREAAVNWMVDYCTKNKSATVHDGAQILATSVARTGAVPVVASAPKPPGPDTDTCRGWMSGMDTSTKLDGRVAQSLKGKVWNELGSYGVQMNDFGWWKGYLFSSDSVMDDVNGWMRKFCARNPNATIVEGVYVLGPQIRRDGGVQK